MIATICETSVAALTRHVLERQAIDIGHGTSLQLLNFTKGD